jgi:hypothetical protein
VVVFIAYVLLRAVSASSAIHQPRELADTDIYLRISSEPIVGPEFLQVDRPFVFPLLLQFVHRDLVLAAMIQLGITIFAWGLLAFLLSGAFRYEWLKFSSFVVILALSLVRHLAGWDFVMMTESLSLSTFVLFISSGIWLIYDRRWYKLVVVGLISVLFAFARDTNAYVLLMVSTMLLLAVALRWIQPRVAVLPVMFLLVFFVNNLNADVSERWRFPFINVVGKRILPFSLEIQRMESCGMPVSPALLERADSFANGDDSAFLNDPALLSFRRWVNERGKSCYIRWLAADPLARSRQVLLEFNRLIYFEDVGWFFSRRYSDLLPSRVERVLYPVHHVPWLWVGITLTALIATVQRAWRDNNLWVIFIMLSLTIFPHLFITWHGDAMAPERHALSVGLQVALSMWLFLFLAVEKGASLMFRKFAAA